MADGYIEDGLEVSAGAVTQEILDGLAARLGINWAAADAHVEAALAGVVGPLVAENREVASLMLRSAFNSFVEDMVGIPIVEATPATAAVTVTAVDTAGYLLEAGSQFSIRDGSGVEVGFEVREDVVIPAGVAVTTAGGVILDAVVPGAGGTGLTGPITPVSSLPWVASVAMFDARSTGGVDAEDRDAYHSRASLLLTLYKPAVTLAADAALYVRLTIPQIGRALALDNYNPANGTFNNDRMLAVAVAGIDGLAVAAAVKAQAQAALAALAESNAITNIIDPTTTAIDVTATAVARPGYATATVDTAVTAALADYLSPARWGSGPTLGDAVSGVPWTVEQTVRRSELEEQVNRVDGVHYVSSLTFRKGADAFATANVVLPGAAPLTTPGALDITVTAP